MSIPPRSLQKLCKAVGAGRTQKRRGSGCSLRTAHWSPSLALSGARWCLTQLWRLSGAGRLRHRSLDYQPEVMSG